MDFDFSEVETKKVEVDLELLINKILDGKAILFTGAGFSFGSKTIEGKEPLGAKDLSHEICKMAKIKANDKLSFSSDYYLSKFPAIKLISFLKKNFTLKEVSKSHEAICSLNWRRFYTTNYDKSIELAAQVSKKLIETIDLKNNTEEYYKRDGLCIHLNGSIDNLTTDTLNNSFKLSSSSYISPESFIDSDWFYYFKRDIERTSALVFIGYSLYDIDIQKILYEDESLKNKTYFITIEDPDEELEFTLSKFGHVIPIGTDRFARYISENVDLDEISKQEYSLQSLSLYEVSSIDEDIRDEHVEKMLMYGDISSSAIDSCVLQEQKIPFLILRNCLDKVYQLIVERKNTIIYSSLGNGKTLLLKELRCYLTRNGLNIYELDDLDGDYISDIDFLAKKNIHSIILLDDYESCIDLIEHVAHSNPENISIVAVSRISDHEYCRDSLSDVNFQYYEINIDTLEDSELEKFVEIIDNLGLWGDKAGFPLAQKIRYLKRENEGQISGILLSLLDSPNIKSKIKSIISKLQSNSEYKSTTLAICLCKVLGIEINRSIISEISGNDAILNPEFIKNTYFRQLFHVVDGNVISGSSLFCIHLIKEYFSASYITDQLLLVAERFSKLDSRDYVQSRIFKSMLKFSFVERILPKTTKVGNLQRYYEGLKVAIPWLRNDPHFWLQYAMSFMGFKDYNKAQGFMDQAYALAEAKNNYHTDNIDTQQARLWLSASDVISDGNIVFSNFEKANGLLRHLKNDTYKLRQVVRYKDFFKNNFSKLSKTNKDKFINSCNDMISNIEINNDDLSVSPQQVERTKDLLLSITHNN